MERIKANFLSDQNIFSLKITDKMFNDKKNKINLVILSLANEVKKFLKFKVINIPKKRIIKTLIIAKSIPSAGFNANWKGKNSNREAKTMDA